MDDYKTEDLEMASQKGFKYIVHTELSELMKKLEKLTGQKEKIFKCVDCEKNGGKVLQYRLDSRVYEYEQCMKCKLGEAKAKLEELTGLKEDTFKCVKCEKQTLKYERCIQCKSHYCTECEFDREDYLDRFDIWLLDAEKEDDIDEDMFYCCRSCEECQKTFCIHCVSSKTTKCQKCQKK
jgi:hypothetical protein